MNKSKLASLLFSLVFTQVSFANDLVANASNASVKGIDISNDSIYWKFPGSIGLNASQAYFNDYCMDGVGSSATFDVFLKLNANYAKDKIMWNNGFDAKLGFIYSDQFSGDDEIRKNMDNFDLHSKFGYKAADKLYYSAFANLESQFTKGYNYEMKDINNLDSAVLVSNFFAPAYLKVAVGMDYIPNKYISVFFSPLTARFTFCTDTLLSDRYGMELDSDGKYKKVRSEVGAFSKIESDFDISKNVHFYSSLEGFYAYNKAVQRLNTLRSSDGEYIYFDEIPELQPDALSDTDTYKDLHGWYVKWKMEVMAKVTKYINVSLRTQVKFDNAETKKNEKVLQQERSTRGRTSDRWELGYPTAKTQFWESISLGIAYTF